VHEPSAPTRAQRTAPWLIALAGFIFDLAAFWPGLMSFDSAYAWWQVRGGESTNIVPPVFVDLWRACDAVVQGPGGLFALHLAMFWCGLALLMRGLRAGPLATFATMLFVSMAPVSLILRGHVWTDVGLIAALVFATGALACAQRRQDRRWLLPAALALFYAAALRHNALPAVVPFVAWSAWLLLRNAGATRVALATVVFLLATVGTIHVLESRVDRPVPLWPSLAQWDLAGVSVITNELRLPPFMVGPGLDVAELAAAFRPWSNTPMLTGTQHGMRDPFSGFSAEELHALRTAWIDAIVDTPRAWLTHRARLSAALFGTHAADWPHELIYVDDETAYRDNPSIARNTGWLHANLMRTAARLLATPALAAWPCLALGAIGAVLAWRRRRDAAGRWAMLPLASAWLYALPLCVLAPAAELRYLGWPCVASLLTFACAAFAPRSVSR
jgi:hypothetical protein